MRKLICFMLILGILVLSAGCFNISSMPFNGDITFHDIALTVPEKFIRDSTQSNDDQWIFEYHNYAEYIILVRSEIGQQNAEEFLKTYQNSMAEVGTSELITFQGKAAVHSSYTKDGISCNELFFPYQDAFYAIALRGASDADFQQLIGSVSLIPPVET